MPSSPDAISTHSLHELAARFDIEPPKRDLEITGLNTIDDAGPSELTFLANDRYAVRLKDSKAGAALVPADFEGSAPMPMLRTERPRMVFAELLALFHPPRAHVVSRHPTAVVPESCTLGAGVSIGAFVVLGENVQVGAGSILHPHCVLYDDVVLGSGCEIHSHVSIREGSVLRDRVLIHNGTIIGADGFGFEPDARGHLHKVPQVGIVEIGSDVELGANVCVDRAALGATRIGDGTKVDNQVQIAHGCSIGRHTILCGQVGIAGSAKIGNHVVIGGQAGTAGHIEIGDGANIAGCAGVMGDIEPGIQVAGMPAIPLKEALRAALYAPKMPGMSRRLKKLERTVADLADAD